MCCGSHRGNWWQEITEAVTDAERCRCRGFSEKTISLIPQEAAECICLRSMDGEDMRCSVCRENCPQEWTPRVMSKAAIEAMERAHSRAEAAKH
jgi:hypothetical protein